MRVAYELELYLLCFSCIHIGTIRLLSVIVSMYYLIT